VGQQVSVKGARTLVGRIVARAGDEFSADDRLTAKRVPQLTHLFPTAPALSTTDLNAIGMPAKRVATLLSLANVVASGEVSFQVQGELVDFVEVLKQIPGIGDWTAQYIAMRALGEPDAFPAADLGIIRALAGDGQRPTPKQVAARAEVWRPWRAYAAIYLWHS
jgi:3-methyladenine DNA glycosylase/8-oxoguanine DNA glycosylase